MSRARGGEDGVSIEEQFENLNIRQPAERSARPPPQAQQQSQGQQQQQQKRPEMKGPSDISNILSGLKTKTVSMPPPTQINPSAAQANALSSTNEELKSRTKRKQKSDKNIVSLDI